MYMFYSLGRISIPIIEIIEKHFENIATDETIVTHERYEHILQNHPQDVGLFEKYGKMCIEEPDLVIRDLKNEATLFMIKKLPETNLNVVIRLALHGDGENRKNSVMTFYRIREKNLKKLASNNKLLYSK